MRFQTQDPLAEKYYNLSPYTMCADNMVRYTDPDGRFIPLVVAAIVEAPEIYLLGAALIGSITASVHHYQNQDQSTYNSEPSSQQSSNSNNIQAKANANQSQAKAKTNNLQTATASPTPK